MPVGHSVGCGFHHEAQAFGARVEGRAGMPDQRVRRKNRRKNQLLSKEVSKAMSM